MFNAINNNNEIIYIISHIVPQNYMNRTMCIRITSLRMLVYSIVRVVETMERKRKNKHYSWILDDR